MSQPTHRTVKIIGTKILCPYCGKPNQLDPPLLCCGEMHAEKFYFADDENFWNEHELKELKKTCEVIYE